jgi:hypothetical protein
MSIKCCTLCKVDKPVSEFSKKSASKDGLSSNCKACHKLQNVKWRAENVERIAATAKQWRDDNVERKAAMNKAWKYANKDRIISVMKVWNAENKDCRAESGKAWRKANPERCIEIAKAWAAENPDKVNQKARTWRALNPHKVNAQSAKRRMVVDQAIPAWADLKEIQGFYKEAKRLEIQTGIKHHVDHDIPLRHRLVCGLHVAANLQILTATENLKKKNKFVI